MAILIDESTKVLVQGITGKIGAFHTQEMIEYGTKVVGGVTPGKGGSEVHGRPVFDTVKDAVAATGAEASIVFVPPPYAADSIMEAADAGIKVCVAITDGIPAQDMIRVKRYMRRYKAENRMRLMGPNCAGVISPGRCLLGIMPGHIYLRGRVGVVGRSGTLGYEAAAQMKELGIGISTSVGIGGDPINGSSFKDALEQFEADAGDRCGPDDRRDRRAAGGRGRRVRVRSYAQAGRGLRRRSVRAQGPQDGPCRGDHLGLRRERAGEGRDSPRGGRHDSSDAGRAGDHHGGPARPAAQSNPAPGELRCLRLRVPVGAAQIAGGGEGLLGLGRGHRQRIVRVSATPPLAPTVSASAAASLALGNSKVTWKSSSPKVT